ncbi:Uncharacterized protein BM_BM17380 [Brugia malayi]|uniref:Uncharacterized protein n=1 Tax=Brugia malayi TaxID=6279 RepID=A0A4E9F5F8_BRUMA|nr:Uncharacterized protein BM_BM17380 [Brugia malayi]VIO91100.1 Uncharacterized protein BM_BM17380 [Brugia malayi]
MEMTKEMTTQAEHRNGQERAAAAATTMTTTAAAAIDMKVIEVAELSMAPSTKCKPSMAKTRSMAPHSHWPSFCAGFISLLTQLGCVLFRRGVLLAPLAPPAPPPPSSSAAAAASAPAAAATAMAEAALVTEY